MSDQAAFEISTTMNKVVTLPPKRYRCRLETLSDVKKEMGKLYREARSGVVDIQDATKLTWCLQAVAKAIEGSDLEKRITLLEACVNEKE